MLLTREFADPFIVYVAMLSLCVAVLTMWTVRDPYRAGSSEGDEVRQLLIVTVVCTLGAWIGGGNAGAALIAAGVSTLIGAGLRLALPRLTLIGALAMTTPSLAFLAWVPWTWLLLGESEAAGWLITMSVIGSVVALVGLGFVFIEGLARQALLTHATWRTPHRPLPPHAGAQPKVSIHLPCYAEPPEVVIATLDRLARLDYPDFEVLVCDNNTADAALWRPVEAHCARLDRDGARFRFFHVAPLAGAKAGALNFCLDHMARDAELVAVIDADYLSAPDFLSRLVGFFDDPAIGYVQTPHDYRDWAGNPYLTACYWEYMPNNKVELPGLNEYGAAFTIGTMCVIRTEALERAGRWAEWCLTEDSEVSVRLRAVGYSGLYLRDSFGWGLIPETFGDYKKQRFRWTAGPVQQLRRHWRLYLPGRWHVASALDGWSRLLEVLRGVAPVLNALGIVMGVVGAAVYLTLAAHGAVPVIALPVAAWLAMAVALASGLVGRWHRYRLSGCVRVGDMLRGELARMSLGYVQMLGGVAGLSSKPLAWRRTPKFQARGSGLRALVDTMPETAIGIAHLMLLTVPVTLADRIGWHVAALMLVGGLVSAMRFLAAPAMAMLSERDLARAMRASQPPARLPEQLALRS